MRITRDISFRLSPDAAVIKFCNSVALFSEATQKIYQLDDLGGLLIPKLKDGAGFYQLVEDIIRGGIKQELALVCAENLLSSLATDGLLEIELPSHSMPPSGTYKLAGLSVCLAGSPAPIAKLISPLLALSAKTRRRPDVVYRITPLHNRVCVVRRPHRDVIVDMAEIVPALKASLSQDILDDTKDDVALHGALLVRNGKGLVLCGEPGAGKSTLAAFLTGKGYRYESDDICMLDKRGRATGIPFPVTLKAESWKLLRGLGGKINDLPIHRRLDGKMVRYFAPAEPPTSTKVAVERIVYLKRNKKSMAAVQPIAINEALSRLIEASYSSSLGLSKSQVQGFLDVLTRIRFDELHYADLAAVPVLLKT